MGITNIRVDHRVIIRGIRNVTLNHDLRDVPPEARLGSFSLRYSYFRPSLLPDLHNPKECFRGIKFVL